MLVPLLLCHTDWTWPTSRKLMARNRVTPLAAVGGAQLLVLGQYYSCRGGGWSGIKHKDSRVAIQTWRQNDTIFLP